MTSLCAATLVFLASVGLVLFFRLSSRYDEGALHEMYTTHTQQGDDVISAMSFNVRLDCEESNLDNHFTRRVSRLRDTIMKWKPNVVGMQEPFGGQVHHMLLEFPKGHTYRAIGYPRPGVDPDHLTHPSRHQDLKCGILYDTAVLELLSQDYRWLSETPKVEGSKSWGSRGSRVANLAHFRVKATGAHVVVVNTHLDVWSEEARRGQSAMLLSLVRDVKEKHPQAAVVVTGDFNSAPGQAAHRTLLEGGLLSDAWEGVAEHKNDAVASSFHGFMGVSLSSSLPSRMMQSVLFTLYGMGVTLPSNVPTTFREVLRGVRNLATTAPRFGIAESMPKHFWSLSRFHVDWVLHTNDVRPELIAVCDVRDSEFSSDHFPLVTLFRWTK